VLTLIDIAVNNAIVLLDYANRQVRDGQTISAALWQATSIRLRPILVTAITAIFALLPVALNPAVGSRIFQPFAITVIGGLFTSTIATVVLVPTLAAKSHELETKKGGKARFRAIANPDLHIKVDS
jgi:multidrug efflux pump subunit AcrB